MSMKSMFIVYIYHVIIYHLALLCFVQMIEEKLYPSISFHKDVVLQFQRVKENILIQILIWFENCKL